MVSKIVKKSTVSAKAKTTPESVKTSTKIVKKVKMTKKEKEVLDNVTKTLTPVQLLTQFTEALQEHKNLTDEDIKQAVVSAKVNVPRSFPSKWGGSGKPKRPEGKPRGSRNAYIIFSQEVRPKLRSEHPDVPNACKKEENIETITGMIGKLWNEMDDKKKNKYEAQSQADKERYEKEMVVWESENPNYARKSRKETRPAKRTAYQVFARENRNKVMSENPGTKGRQINKLLASVWGELTDEDREQYQNTANQENECYEERLAEYKEKHPSVNPNDSENVVENTLSDKEQAKADDPDNYVMGVKGRYVKRTSKAGKEAEKAVQEGNHQFLNNDVATDDGVDSDNDLMVE